MSWPHRLDDWRMMLTTGRGLGAFDANGRLVGTALWWPCGLDLATLGMVIVAPELQGRGLGRHLMDSVLQDAGDRAVMLNATAAGLRLYEAIGFRAVSAFHQHQGEVGGAPIRPPPAGAVVRPLTPADGTIVRSLDATAFGAPRQSMLSHLLAESEGLVLEAGGVPRGYAVRRRFGRGLLVGPVVAEDEAAALALVSEWASRTAGFLRLDVPANAAALGGYLAAAGMPQVGRAVTMARGSATWTPTGRVFGLASQAMG